MPQEFQVLRCCECNTFQSHPVKKANKWTCKMCGQKQSTIKVYGLGSGADCRHHVQKLNMLRGQMEEHPVSNSEPEETGSNIQLVRPSGSRWQHCLELPATEKPRNNVSRWQHYLESPGPAAEEAGDHVDETFTTDTVQFERARKSQRKESYKRMGGKRKMHQDWYQRPTNAGHRPFHHNQSEGTSLQEETTPKHYNKAYEGNKGTETNSSTLGRPLESGQVSSGFGRNQRPQVLTPDSNNQKSQLNAAVQGGSVKPVKKNTPWNAEREPLESKASSQTPDSASGTRSKWSQFLEPNVLAEDSDDQDLENDSEIPPNIIGSLVNDISNTDYVHSRNGTTTGGEIDQSNGFYQNETEKDCQNRRIMFEAEPQFNAGCLQTIVKHSHTDNPDYSKSCTPTFTLDDDVDEILSEW